ncbi:MAG: polysaccharide deacetylase family protein [Acidobacteriota bacterium]
MTALQRLGAFDLAADSRWRRQRLLILCYHGISLDDEHAWNNQLYMSAEAFEKRLEFLRDEGYQVLDLGEAVARLYKRDLPPRSAVITIDDGAYDCYARAFPILKRFGYPFTVYQTTYYCDYNRPIFRLICSYMMWKKRGVVVDGRNLPGLDGEPGLDGKMDLRSSESRQSVLDQLDRYTKQHHSSASEKDEIASQLAERIGIDYGELRKTRVLHLMTPDEVGTLARAGVSIQLHTHRHRTPVDEPLFKREIDDNRRRIEEMTGRTPTHFCYPSGVHQSQFLPWLSQEGVATATTCLPALASPASNPLLLPRLVDHSGLSMLEFASWGTGVRAFLPQRDQVAVDPNL